MFFRNPRHPANTLQALKRFYARNELLPDADAKLDLEFVTSVEEMAELMNEDVLAREVRELEEWMKTRGR